MDFSSSDDLPSFTDSSFFDPLPDLESLDFANDSSYITCDVESTPFSPQTYATRPSSSIFQQNKSNLTVSIPTASPGILFSAPSASPSSSDSLATPLSTSAQYTHHSHSGSHRYLPYQTTPRSKSGHRRRAVSASNETASHFLNSVGSHSVGSLSQSNLLLTDASWVATPAGSKQPIHSTRSLPAAPLTPTSIASSSLISIDASPLITNNDLCSQTELWSSNGLMSTLGLSSNFELSPHLESKVGSDNLDLENLLSVFSHNDLASLASASTASLFGSDSASYPSSNASRFSYLQTQSTLDDLSEALPFDESTRWMMQLVQSGIDPNVLAALTGANSQAMNSEKQNESGLYDVKEESEDRTSMPPPTIQIDLCGIPKSEPDVDMDEANTEASNNNTSSVSQSNEEMIHLFKGYVTKFSKTKKQLIQAVCAIPHDLSKRPRSILRSQPKTKGNIGADDANGAFAAAPSSGLEDDGTRFFLLIKTPLNVFHLLTTLDLQDPKSLLLNVFLNNWVKFPSTSSSGDNKYHARTPNLMNDAGPIASITMSKLKLKNRRKNIPQYLSILSSIGCSYVSFENYSTSSGMFRHHGFGSETNMLKELVFHLSTAKVGASVSTSLHDVTKWECQEAIWGMNGCPVSKRYRVVVLD